MGKSPEWYQETLGDGHPVIIYLHGNLGTRWDESGRIETLELILMESSGYYMTAQSSGFIHGHNAHKDFWIRLKESENQLYSFLSCHLCRAINHRVELVKVRFMFLKLIFSFGEWF